MNNKILNAKILHVANSTAQWAEEESVIPRGMLCVEFTASGATKIKIGDGTKTFSDLPYTDSTDLSNYYSKSETENAIKDAVEAIGSVITIKGTADSITALPQNGNKPGDLWFVNSDITDNDIYSEYVWTQSGTW
ncbi:MAG: hypothetical protein ACI4I9_04555 [Porcipelethomonas sp.]